MNKRPYIDKNKIIIMSNLAVYEKRYARKDFVISNYFKNDFVYVRNAWTRFFVIIGATILYPLFFQSVFSFEDFTVTIANGKLLLLFTIIYYALFIIVYTFISSYFAKQEYDEAIKRVESYEYLLSLLTKQK